MGTVFGQAAVLLATPAFTRLYGAAELGKLGVFAAFLLPAGAIAALRMEYAIPLARDRAEADRLLAITLGIVPIMSVLLAGCFAALSGLRLMGFGALPPVNAIWMLIILIATGCFSGLRMWSVSRGDFHAISVALVVQGLARALVPIALAPFSAGWYGLLGGEVMGRIVGVRRLFLDAREPLKKLSRALTLRLTLVSIRKYRHFPLVFTPSSLLDTLAATISVPIIAATLGLEPAGQFLIAQRIISAPGSLISASVGDVVHARLVEGARRSQLEVRSVVKSLAWKLALGALLLLVPIVILAPLYAEPIFGSGWQLAGVLVAVLGPYAISGIVVNPVSRALFLSSVPQLKLLADAVRLVLPNLGLVIALNRLESLAQCVAVFSGLAVLGDCFYLALIWFCVAPRRQRELT